MASAGEGAPMLIWIRTRLAWACHRTRAAYLRLRIRWAEEELASVHPLDINPLQAIHIRVSITRMQRDLEQITQKGLVQ